jgi:hypothetical protein
MSGGIGHEWRDTGGNAHNNWAKNRECQRTSPDSAGFFILAVRGSFRAGARSGHGPGYLLG